MASDKTPNGAGWAKVPHGIIDTAIAGTLKLLLWYCYDKPEAWKFSVPKVARSLDKSPQCIRGYFRQFADAGVFTKAGDWQSKRGLVPLYAFHPGQVDAFIKTQLKVNRETDPETDRERNPETDPETHLENDRETDPAIGVSHSKNNVPRTSTEKKGKEKESTKPDGTNGIDGPPSLKAPPDQNGTNLAVEFERFLQEAGSTPGIASSPSGSSSGGSQPAEGGVAVGDASTPGASSSPSTTIQYACGNSNAGGQNRVDNGLVPVSAPIIQGSVSGNTNTGAPESNAGHPGASAQRAAGASAKSGGVRGALPNDVVEHAQWKLRQWKKHSPCTKQSFEIIERELWKELSGYKWNPRPGWCTPLQDVNTAFDKVVRMHAQYE